MYEQGVAEVAPQQPHLPLTQGRSLKSSNTLESTVILESNEINFHVSGESEAVMQKRSTACRVVQWSRETAVQGWVMNEAEVIQSLYSDYCVMITCMTRF
jgi:hypothetical protein